MKTLPRAWKWQCNSCAEEGAAGRAASQPANAAQLPHVPEPARCSRLRIHIRAPAGAVQEACSSGEGGKPGPARARHRHPFTPGCSGCCAAASSWDAEGAAAGGEASSYYLPTKHANIPPFILHLLFLHYNFCRNVKRIAERLSVISYALLSHFFERNLNIHLFKIRFSAHCMFHFGKDSFPNKPINCKQLPKI